jgi:hypothetical protein
LLAPQPELASKSAKLGELTNLVVLRGGVFRGLDLSKADLSCVRIHNCRFEDCCFDAAKLQDVRAWGSTFSGVSMRGADLRKAALGGLEQGKRNVYTRVDFGKADLRQTVYQSADFTDCDFSQAKLAKVDFQGSVFVRCVFAGDLKEVMFHKHAFRGESLPANGMQGVDFRAAHFHYTEFRGLDMSDIGWPESDEHVVIDAYPATLDRIIATLRERDDTTARQLVAILGHQRKWAGAGQRKGVVSKADVADCGEDAVATFMALIDGASREG